MRYGTRQFGGLKTQVAEHLLDDGDLVRADNANFDIIGAIKAEGGDTELTSATITAPNGLGYAYSGGSSQYYYKDTNVYDETYVRRYDVVAGSASTLGGTVEWPNTGDGQLFVTQGNGEAVLTDGETPYVHHDVSGFTRKLGPLVGTDNKDVPIGPLVNVLANSATGGISAISVDGNGVVTVTSSTHLRTTGDRVYIKDVAGGYTEINKGTYTITVVTPDTFTLDDTNGLNWVTGSLSAGDWYYNACGNAGDYQYWVGYTLTMTGRDEVVTSSLEPIPFRAGEFTETLAVTDEVDVYVNGVSAADLYAYFHRTNGLVDSAVTADQIQVTCRIYRSRAGGTTPYLIKEFTHDTTYETATSYLVFTDTIQDSATGAAWLEETVDAHDAPPSCSLFEVSRGRAYCVDGNNLHFSLTGNYDYWPPTYYITMPEDITAIRNAGDYLVVFSATRMWLYYHDDILGTLKEIPVQQGVLAQTAAISLAGNVAFENEMGMGSVVFANDLGLWLVGPGGLQELTRGVRDDWVSSSGGTWSGTVLGDKMMWTCDKGAGSSDQAWTFHMAGGNLVIGRTAQPSTQDYEVLIADPVNNKIITQQADGIYEFGTDSDSPKTLQTESKWYGSGTPGTVTRVVLDVSGSATGSVSILSNVKATPTTASFTNGRNQRSLVYVNVGTELSEFWRVGVSTTGTLYGYWIEVNEAQGVY